MKRQFRRTLRFLPAVLTAAALMVVSGCDFLTLPVTPAGMSVEERIENFMTDLNSDSREEIYLNFHPVSTESYNQIKDTTYWEDVPLSSFYRPFGTNGVEVGTEAADGTLTVTGNLTNTVNDTDGYPFTMVMERYDSDWRIKTFTLPIDPENPFEIRVIR